MAQAKIDLSGIGGLTPSYNRLSREYIQYGNDSQLVEGYWNPFVLPSYMSPARTYKKELTGSLGTIHKTRVHDIASGKLLTGSTDGHITYYASLDSTGFSSDIASAGVTEILDFEIYQLNGVRKIFYTNNTAFGGQIGVTDGTFFQPDWSNSGTNINLYTGAVVGGGLFSVSGGYSGFLRVASNGFMYLFDQTTVTKIDGTVDGGSAGTITTGVFNVQSTQKIVDAVDWKQTMWVAVEDSATPFSTPTGVERQSKICGVYTWDRVSTVSGSRDFIPLYGVKSIRRIFVSHDGKLRMFTIGSSNQLQLREYTGSSFEVLFEFNQTASPQSHDSISTSDYGTFWLGQDYNIYCHGRPSPGFDNGVFKLGKISNGTVNGAGWILFGNGSEQAAGTDALLYSYTNTTTSTNKIQKFLFNYIGSSPAGYDNGAAYASTQYTKNIPLPKLANVEQLFVFCQTNQTSDSGDGSSVVATIKVYLNQSSTAYKSQSVTRKDIRKGYISIPLTKQYVNSIQLGVDYSTTTNSSVGSFDFNPNYALLEYEPTQTKK